MSRRTCSYFIPDVGPVSKDTYDIWKQEQEESASENQAKPQAKTDAQKELARLKREALVNRFDTTWRQVGGLPLIGKEGEYKFHPVRQWRFDRYQPEARVGIEIEGGTHSGGRHVRGTGYMKDCEKYNAAHFMGIPVIRLTTELITFDYLAEVAAFVEARAHERKDAPVSAGAADGERDRES